MSCPVMFIHVLCLRSDHDFLVLAWLSFVFFVNDTATTVIYTYGHTLSLHDALPIYGAAELGVELDSHIAFVIDAMRARASLLGLRSEEHTSELQSLMRTSYAVFCLKNKKCQQKEHRR